MNEEVAHVPKSDTAYLAAAEARKALRALAQAAQSLDDPRQINKILDDLSYAAASLADSMQVISDRRERPTRYTALVNGNPYDGHATEFKVSTALGRAASLFEMAGAAIDRALQVEATLTHVRDYGITVRNLCLVETAVEL